MARPEHPSRRPSRAADSSSRTNHSKHALTASQRAADPETVDGDLESRRSHRHEKKQLRQGLGRARHGGQRLVDEVAHDAGQRGAVTPTATRVRLHGMAETEGDERSRSRRNSASTRSSRSTSLHRGATTTSSAPGEQQEVFDQVLQPCGLGAHASARLRSATPARSADHDLGSGCADEMDSASRDQHRRQNDRCRLHRETRAGRASRSSCGPSAATSSRDDGNRDPREQVGRPDAPPFATRMASTGRRATTDREPRSPRPTTTVRRIGTPITASGCTNCWVVLGHGEGLDRR